ncbi:MAG: hypothetical protein ACLFVJ_00465 [Persicimonas sp.]
MSESDDNIAYEDVDDVIALAERLRADDQEMLSDEELEEVGADVGIPARYIEQAKRDLAEQRAQEQRQAKQAEREAARAAKTRRKLAIGAAAAIALLGSILAIWSMSATSELRGLHAEVESHRAEVDNVRARKVAIERQFADRPDSLEKDAQIVGSQNRLRVAIRRYNEAVARYNAEAQSFPNTLWTGSESLPTRVEHQDRP